VFYLVTRIENLNRNASKQIKETKGRSSSSTSNKLTKNSWLSLYDTVKIIQILWQTNDKTDWENKLIGGCMHNLVKLDAIWNRFDHETTCDNNPQTQTPRRDETPL